MPNKNGHLPRIVQVAILVCVSFIYWHVWHRLQLIKAQWETVNRVVYPVKDTDLTLPLYAVNWHPSHFDANVFDERDSMMSVNLNAVSRSDFQ